MDDVDLFHIGTWPTGRDMLLSHSSVIFLRKKTWCYWPINSLQEYLQHSLEWTDFVKTWSNSVSQCTIFVLNVFRLILIRTRRFDLQLKARCARAIDVWVKARRAFGPQCETAPGGRSQLRWAGWKTRASADYGDQDRDFDWSKMRSSAIRHLPKMNLIAKESGEWGNERGPEAGLGGCLTGPALDGLSRWRQQERGFLPRCVSV
jgi:hypothetical protein